MVSRGVRLSSMTNDEHADLHAEASRTVAEHAAAEAALRERAEGSSPFAFGEELDRLRARVAETLRAKSEAQTRLDDATD